MESVFGEEAIGAEAHGFGEGGLSAVGVGEPDVDVGEAALDAFDDGEFFAIEAIEAEDDRRVEERAAAEMDHRVVGLVDFGADVAAFLQGGGGGGAEGELADD